MKKPVVWTTCLLLALAPTLEAAEGTSVGKASEDGSNTAKGSNWAPWVIAFGVIAIGVAALILIHRHGHHHHSHSH
jgi:hypothetical protein